MLETKRQAVLRKLAKKSGSGHVCSVAHPGATHGAWEGGQRVLHHKKKKLTEKLKEKTAEKVGIITKGLAKLTGAPFKGLGEVAKAIGVGTKSTRGAMKGRRLAYKGTKPISQSEYLSLKAQAKRKGVDAGATGSGIPGVRQKAGPQGQLYHEKDLYRPGGVAGWAMEHPVLATLGVGGTYMYVSQPRHPGVNINMTAPPQQAPPPRNPNPWG